MTRDKHTKDQASGQGVPLPETAYDPRASWTPENPAFDEITTDRQGHTPGPWAQEHRKVNNDGYRTQVFPVSDPDDAIATIHWHCVPTGSGYTTDREANARLIAAAPDMLEALRYCEEHLSACMSEDMYPLYMVRDVLAKATGAKL